MPRGYGNSDGMLHFRQADGNTWRDSGEGGLYAYLIVPKEEDYDSENHQRLETCIVETHASLLRAHLVSSSGHNDPYKAEEDLWDEDEGFPTSLNEAAAGDLIEWAYKNYSYGLYAAIYLGSTSHTVYNDAAGYVWPTYTYNDLTEDGQKIYDILKGMYKIEPIILLFLDT